MASEVKKTVGEGITHRVAGGNAGLAATARVLSLFNSLAGGAALRAPLGS